MKILNAIAATLTTVLVSLPAICLWHADAIAENRYLSMGNDSNGNPVLLDTESINGTRYSLVVQVEGNPAILSLTASCKTSRLTVNRLTIFDRQGNQIFDNQSPEELNFPPNSPTARSLAEVCRRL